MRQLNDNDSQGSYSDTFAISLTNIILEEIKSIEQEIQEIKVDLQTFEQQYQLSSEQFYQQFKAGKLGDEIDFVDWSAFYQMWYSLQERLNLLKSQL